MQIKNICVLGGSGFVGKHLVHQLAERGFNVRVLTRNRERAKTLIVLPNVDVVEANIFDPEALDLHFHRANAVINLVGTLHEETLSRAEYNRGRRRSFEAVHIELVRKIVVACNKNQVKRLLHMSALNAHPNAPSNYLRSKGEGEKLVRDSGVPHPSGEDWHLNKVDAQTTLDLETTVFRPSVIFGREDQFLNKFAQLLKWFPVIPLASAGSKFQPIWVEDVARCFVESLTKLSTFGQAYNLCGPKIYSLREMVELVGRIVGRRPRIISLNERLSYMQAALFEKLPGKLITRDNLNSMKADNVCADQFPAVFGFQPAALEAIVPDYVGQYSSRARYNLFRSTAGRS